MGTHEPKVSKHLCTAGPPRGPTHARGGSSQNVSQHCTQMKGTETLRGWGGGGAMAPVWNPGGEEACVSTAPQRKIGPRLFADCPPRLGDSFAAAFLDIGKRNTGAVKATCKADRTELGA